MIQGFRTVGRAATAMVLSAGLLAAVAPSASALAMPAEDTPLVLDGTATDPAPDDAATNLTDGLADAVPAALDGLLLGLLAILPAPESMPADGVWFPGHEEEMAIIPICSGPVATLDWLFVNISDHGTDIGKFLSGYSTQITALVSNSADPYEMMQLLTMPFIQIPVYAINDTRFHQPATIGDILSFCESTRA